MLNDDDKDKNFESHEESEYHFSDDDASYEVEPEAPETRKAEAPKEEGQKVNLLNKFAQSKRMLISGAVFILLIFVVYKMVTPTSTTPPSTDITIATAPKAPMPVTSPQAPGPQVTNTAEAQSVIPLAQPGGLANGGQPGQLSAVSQTQPMMVPPGGTTTSIAPTATREMSANVTTMEGLPTQPSIAQTSAPTLPTPGGGTAQTVTPSQAAPTSSSGVGQAPTGGGAIAGVPSTQGVIATPPQGALPVPGAMGQAGTAITQATSSAMTQTSGAIAQGAEIAKSTLPQPPSSIVSQAPIPTPTTAPISGREAEQRRALEQAASASMPAIIPVQSPIPTTVATSTIQGPPLSTAPSTLATGGTLQTPLSEKAQTDSISLQARSEQLMTQLQADYSRQLNEYASQNRALQDQMQSLNARVAGMESQLAQLLQALMHPAEHAPKEHETAVEQRITFNVQAIIPGRAWLKSASGETVTVAEGDVVRDLGRITKIDPYDGVVEINTGNKVVALSYGNGG